MNLDHFGMDTITMAGPLEPKLRAVRAAGFTQVMLNASDIVGHPDGEPALARAAASVGTIYTLSSLGSVRPGELAEAAPEAPSSK